MQSISASDRRLPPPATVDLSGMKTRSFQTKVKDKCVRCRGTGLTQGLVCASCHGSGLDEAGLKKMITHDGAGAKSSPTVGGRGMAEVGGPRSDSPAHSAVVPVVATGGGGAAGAPAGGAQGGCCVMS